MILKCSVSWALFIPVIAYYIYMHNKSSIKYLKYPSKFVHHMQQKSNELHIQQNFVK